MGCGAPPGISFASAVCSRRGRARAAVTHRASRAHAAPRRSGAAAPGGLRAFAALLALLAAGEAHAGGLRILILVRGAADREAAARLQGHTADLDAVVDRLEVDLPGDLEGQLAVARAAGARADAVVWFGEDGAGPVAHVARGDRVVSRRIGATSGALSRSAAVEALAVATRTVLALLAAEGEAGPAWAPGGAPRLRAWGEVGWMAALDGARPAGHHGASLRVGGARGRWLLGATLAVLPEVAVDAAPAEIQLSRQTAGLLAGIELLPRRPARPWSLTIELGAGAARFRRVTRAAGTGLAAEPPSVRWSPLVSPGLRVARRLGGGAWLALDAGVDALTHPPRFVIARSTGLERAAAAWAWEPRLAFTLLLDWR